MLFPELTGASYTEQSIIVASQRTVNWRPSLVESNQYKARFALYRTPGLGLFADTGVSGSARGRFSQNGRCFFVIGTKFVEVFADGTFTDHSTASGVDLVDDGFLAQIESNPTQIMILSGLYGYIFTLGTDALVAISDGEFPNGNAQSLAYQDGFFAVSVKNTGEFQISALNNGLAWDSLDTSDAESKPDFISAMKSLQEQLWIFGTQTIQPFYGSTTGDFPFVPNQSSVIEYGIGAPASLVSLDNSLYWLVANENGGGIIARAVGATAKRVSNYALEASMATYGDISTAEGQAYIMDGHTYYRINFPSANDSRGATWQLDVNTGQWMELTWWNTATSLEEAHRARVYTSAFGKILCGDRENGLIYELSMSYLDDNGDVIQRIRRAPHVVKERKQINYIQLRFDGNVGIGLNVEDVTTPGYDPQMRVRWSDDGGRSWGPPRLVRFGKFGEFQCIPQTNALGMGRDRVFEILVTDPVDWAIAAAYFEAKVGPN